MDQQARAHQFTALHVKGKPIVVYNAWDAGSARAIVKGGAPAIATSSWAVAAAHGFGDGEAIPFAFVEQVIAAVVRSVDVPVTADVEGGYSVDPATCAQNVGRLIDAGIVGINFEDRVLPGKGLHPVAAQCARIAAIRRAADERGVALFINARTEAFFGGSASPESAMAEALERARAYAQAGASGFFAPGLVDLAAIKSLAAAIELPLNVMKMPGLPADSALAGAGVARISHGPAPYLLAMEALRAGAQAVFAPPAG